VNDAREGGGEVRRFLIGISRRDMIAPPFLGAVDHVIQ
jgi:hypothetical protein